MKTTPLSSASSPFQNDPEYPIYLYTTALVHSARVPALLLWVVLNATVVLRAAGQSEMAPLMVALKSGGLLLMVVTLVLTVWSAQQPTLRKTIDANMKSDMLYTQKAQSMRKFARSHIAQLLGKLGTFVALSLLIRELCFGWHRWLQ
ncbi:hypothetical protein [Deinococcus misasensis]|uniref:hypothetical protein n=1 Tax=Deinococcus misasensis TaxID=392413 RepID=UPI00055719ED|nr:hypothetical protein [Deinococcus misasensis]